MDELLTLDKILELPNKILKISNEYDDYSERLTESLCDLYDIKKLKPKIVSLFNRFKKVKYFYNFSIESTISITPNYNFDGTLVKNGATSKQEIAVANELDNMLWAARFYNSICIVAKKLTMQEAIYLVSALFGNKSEEIIAERLGVCRKTIQHIKKSCLVKIWQELKPLYEEDNN